MKKKAKYCMKLDILTKIHRTFAKKPMSEKTKCCFLLLTVISLWLLPPFYRKQRFDSYPACFTTFVTKLQ